VPAGQVHAGCWLESGEVTCNISSRYLAGLPIIDACCRPNPAGRASKIGFGKFKYVRLEEIIGTIEGATGADPREK
jgi:hypothetical protein